MQGESALVGRDRRARRIIHDHQHEQETEEELY
jgi:hypothetical protein